MVGGGYGSYIAITLGSISNVKICLDAQRSGIRGNEKCFSNPMVNEER
jgi:hypothetical protein